MPDFSQFQGARLCVVGNLNRDVKTSPFEGGSFLLNDGETSLPGITESVGGGAANCAAAAAALGAECHLLAQIGDDALGQRLQEAMVRHGVKCSLHRGTGLTTGTTMNLVYTSGHRHFLSCHPNNNALSFEHLDLRCLQEVDHLYRADIWFSEAMLRGGNRRLFEAARAEGVATSLDLNWDPQWGRAADSIVEERKRCVRELLPLVDLVHGNARELGEFTGTPQLEVAVARLLEWGTGAVVLHLGRTGAGYFSRADSYVEAPSLVEQPVVATGTGDVLSVCMMLLHKQGGLNLPDKLRLSNQVVGEFMRGGLRLIPEL